MSDFRDSFPNVSSSHCFSESSNGRARVVADLAPLARRVAANFFFDGIQRGDAFDGFGRDRRFMRDVQIVKLSAHMRPAGRFLNAPGFVHRIESRVTIGLQRAREIAEMRLRMLALAIRRVGEPDRRWCCVSRRAIVAHIRP